MGINRGLTKNRILLISNRLNHINDVHSEMGFELKAVKNYADGLQQLSSHEFDVLMFDFDLLYDQTSSGLKSFFTEVKFLPVIIIISNNQLQIKSRLLAAGAIDVLTLVEFKEFSVLSRAVDYAIKNFKTSNQLREYKRALHISQKIANIGSWWWNLDSDEFTVSPVLLDLLHIDKDVNNFTIEGILNTVNENEKERVSSIVFESIKKRKSFVVEFKRAPIKGVLRYFRLKGEVNKNWLGKEVVYQGTCQEITSEKKKTETLLLKSMFLELSGQIALVGGWEYDFATHGLFWSDETYKIHGVSPETFVATMDNLHLLYSKELLAEMDASFVRAIKDRGNFFAEVPYNHHDEIKWLQYIGRIIFKNKTPIKVVGVVYDITENKNQLQNLQLRAALLDNVGVAAIAVDKNYKIVFWNKEAENMFGYSKEETMGHSITEFDVDNNTPEEFDELERRLLKGEVIAKEYLVKTRDGKTFPVWGSYSAVFGTNGQFVAALYLARNIKKEKERLKRIEDSEIRLRRLFEHTPLGRGLIDLKTYKWLDVNNSLVKLLGYSKESLLESSIREIVTPKYHSHRFFQFDEIKNYRSFGPFQMEYVKNNGANLKVIITGFTIQQEQSYTAWLDVMDITELDEKTESLRQSEERFRDYVENSTDVILTIDDKGQIDYISPNVVKALNYTIDVLQGASYLKFIHPDDKRKTIQQVAESIRNHSEDISIIHRVLHSDGTYLYVHSEGKFKLGPSGKKYGIIISRNIDQAHRSQLTIRKQNEVLKEIAFIQSHVLRRPLANIMAMLDLVKLEEVLAHENLRIAELIREEADKMDVIVKDIVQKSNFIRRLAK